MMLPSVRALRAPVNRFQDDGADHLVEVAVPGKFVQAGKVIHDPDGARVLYAEKQPHHLIRYCQAYGLDRVVVDYADELALAGVYFAVLAGPLLWIPRADLHRRSIRDRELRPGRPEYHCPVKACAVIQRRFAIQRIPAARTVILGL